MQHTRSGVVAATALLSVLALVGGSVSSSAPAIAASAPDGLHVTSVAARGVGLTWDATPQNTYRVRFSTSPDMASAKSWAFEGNYFEWTRTDANPSLSAARLLPGGTYYFQVKALDRNRADLSGYSSRLTVTLPADAFPELPPVNLEATGDDADSVHLSWSTRGPGVRYKVRYTDNPDAALADWSSADFPSAGGPLSGLKAGTKYSFSVRVVDAAGNPLSGYSNTWSGTTVGAGSPAIVVTSYNIHKTGSGPAWSARRIAVRDNILSQQPDVAMLQEAVPPKVSVNGSKIPQYQDILNLLGTKYDYATSAYSSGTHLAFDSTRFKLGDSGVKKLYKYGKQPRYAVWAILQDRRTDKRFFALTTHLEPGGRAAKYNRARVKQARQVLALIAKYSRGLPVVVGGDTNSSRANKPNGPYNAFVGGGLVDPLGYAQDTYISTRPGIAEHRVDLEYNSYNGFSRTAKRASYPVGTRVDYFVVRGLRVAEQRTVVTVDTNRQFIGTIPSDHNLITLTVHLP
jgi:endonuclease/exonuclease/phosphatase family metal-dependent hydrolase